MKLGLAPTFSIRPFEDGDEEAVLELLRGALGEGPGGARSLEFFRWKHQDSPFGPSLMFVAEADGRIVGLRAFMRWRFRAGERVLHAVRAVDTATHPEYRRIGIFSRLTGVALEALAGQADLVFNTPNEKSLPGYLKLGWRTVGRLPVSVRIRRPVAFVKALRSLGTEAQPLRKRRPVDAEDAARALEDETGVASLLSEAGDSSTRLVTDRGVDYLRWRYGSAPLLDYRAVREQDGERLWGLALFRVRPRGALWESTVAEVLVRPNDYGTLHRLLRSVARSTSVDHIACRFGPGLSSASRAAGRGYIPYPLGPTLVVRPLKSDMALDLTRREMWNVSIGDLEVF